MSDPGARMLEICQMAPVVPVLVVDDLAKAVPLARALVDGGLRVLEVTLRTEAALPAISAMAEAVPEAVVGAGTLLDEKDVEAALKAGAQFGVSPGVTDPLLDAVAANGLPMLPGTATASDVMRLLDKGHDLMKFFPAEQAGGAAMLKAWSSPLSAARFCPTGGVSPQNAPQYLALPNVVCVGGSWVAPRSHVESGNWEEITALSRDAAKIG